MGIFSAKQAWPARDQKAEIKELHAKIGELTIEKTADGRLVGVIPIDYLLWSAEVAATAR